MVGFAARPLGQPGNVAVDYAFHIEKDRAASGKGCEKGGGEGIDGALCLCAAGRPGYKEMLAKLGLRPIHSPDPNASPPFPQCKDSRGNEGGRSDKIPGGIEVPIAKVGKRQREGQGDGEERIHGSRATINEIA